MLVHRYGPEHEFSKDHNMKDLFQMFPSVIINLVNSRVRHKDKLLVKEYDSGSTHYMHDSFLMGTAFSLKVCLLSYVYPLCNSFHSAAVIQFY
ncbi:hypothetical protein GW17_00036435 [Ensete ventricosum]|nr:hypothetical protein GW17_00036435 [Ensete ventricosum]RZS06381.1 hypothetical protein BHM03_00037039 [Ensete ventricosum]